MKSSRRSLTTATGVTILRWRRPRRKSTTGTPDLRLRSLGLSNFPEEKFAEIIAACEIKPALVQVEAHPYYPQTKLKETLSRYGTSVMAWYPLGHGDKSLVNEPLFTELGKK